MHGIGITVATHKAFLGFVLALAWPAAPLWAGEAGVDFSRQILPILSENCFQCHGPDEGQRQADMRLDTRAGATAVAIVPGDSQSSEAIRRVFSDDPDERMPPPDSNRTLSDVQKELLRRWIDEGAAYSKHWSFAAPVRPPVPEKPEGAIVRNPIDAFVAARLRQEGLQQAPEADKAELLRRVSLDLAGLPPTPEELDAFLADPSSEAYERAVDRLLASPRYGERMVWEWLDAARYADTNGYQGDPTRPMWYWRDWVVEAMNENMPFDRFTIEQLAGDLLPDPTREQLIATGFHRNHMINGEGGRIAEESRVEYVQDRVETTATVWMGLTLTCCRCHTHKYDPFTQQEYYQLAAYFNSIDETGANDAGGLANPVLAFPSQELQARIDSLREQEQQAEKERAELEQKLLAEQPQWEQSLAGQQAPALPEEIAAVLAKPADERSDEEKKKLTEHYLKTRPELSAATEKRDAAKNEREAAERQVPRTMVMRERAEPRETFVLEKGAYNAPREKVNHGVLSDLLPLPPDAPANRLALAQWLVAPAHPLTARVTVNRLWQQFFGIGLVKTAEDFGVQGDKPSHPELLDWLAVEFRECGWDVKQMVRLIVTSATYRQSSKVPPGAAELDPENRLLARGPRLRLPSWMLRDQALWVSGLLAERLGGPPVKGYQPPGIWEDATFGQIRYEQDHGDALYRRSLYTFWRRIVAPTIFFDVANRQNCTVKAGRTNTPLHALVTMNDVTYVEAARALAERTLASPAAGDEARLADMFRRCTARVPAPGELELLAKRLAALRATYAADAAAAEKLVSIGESKRDAGLAPAELAAWTGLALLVLNLDETITKE